MEKKKVFVFDKEFFHNKDPELVAIHENLSVLLGRLSLLKHQIELYFLNHEA